MMSQQQDQRLWRRLDTSPLFLIYMPVVFGWQHSSSVGDDFPRLKLTKLSDDDQTSRHTQ